MNAVFCHGVFDPNEEKNIPDIRIHSFDGRGHFICNELPDILPIIK